MKIGFFLLILVCVFSSVDGKGATRRRRRRESLQKMYKRRTEARQAETDWCQEEADQYGEKNIPYWCSVCLNNTSQCSSPNRTGVTEIKTRVPSGRCDHHPNGWVNCTSLCVIDVTTPGSDPVSCKPLYQNRYLIDTLNTFTVLALGSLIIKIIL